MEHEIKMRSLYLGGVAHVQCGLYRVGEVTPLFISKAYRDNGRGLDSAEREVRREVKRRERGRTLTDNRGR
jgi:hypothetical protein